MDEGQVRTIVWWVVAAPFLGLGLWTLLFNMLRHTRFVGRSGGGSAPRAASSVPLWGSVLVLLGLYLSPLPWLLWFWGILLLEIFSVNFIANEEGPEAV